MKRNSYHLKITALIATVALLTGCETGVKNQTPKTTIAPSGIVDKGTRGYVGYQKSSGNIKAPRIFSNSATPGFYLQVGFFRQSKPNSAFMRRLKISKHKYIVLNKNGDHYALIGPYYSYNQAKRHSASVRSALTRKAFIVQVLRS